MATQGIYRSYEVLIEESVAANHPSRKRTSKQSVADPDIDAALRLTNRIYQDAVCYYVLVLAGMAKRPALNPLWEHLHSGEMETKTQLVIRDLADRYEAFRGISDSLEMLKRTYPSQAIEQDLEDFYELVLEAQIPRDEKTGNLDCENLNQWARGTGLRCCAPKSEIEMPGMGPFDQLHRSLLTETKEQAPAVIREMLPKLKQSNDPTKNKPQYCRAFTKEKTTREGQCSLTIKERADAIRAIRKTEPKPDLFPWLFTTNINSFAWPLSRYLWLAQSGDAALEAKALEDLWAYVQSNKPERALLDRRGEPLKRNSLKPSGGVIFKYFTNCLGIAPGAAAAIWEKFDESALRRAGEEVFKYKVRSREREQNRAEIEQQLSAFRGNGSFDEQRDAETGVTRKVWKIRGMSGDARLGLMEDLLNDLGRDVGGYSLRRATIGGWTDLLSEFKRLARENPEDLPGELLAAVERSQAESGGGFGSARFFGELCKPKYQPIWASTPAEDFHAEDFVRHYVRFSELVEKSERLREDIRFTWPGRPNRHGKPSDRHLDFKAALGAKLKATLFFQVPGPPPRYDIKRDVVLTLSGRRLKRDLIMTAQGDSLRAVWCPPLVMPDCAPKLGKGKKADGPLEVSFSLFAPEARAGTIPEPAYLGVAVPVPGKELKDLQKGQVNWGKSLAWNKDFTGRFFKWPCDVELEKTKTAGQKSKTKRRPVTTKKPPAESKDLWCGDGSPLKQFNVVKAENFHALAVDLGVRCAGAFTRAKVGLDPNGRRLTPDGNGEACVSIEPYRFGMFRLPGEDVMVWNHGKLEQEAFGSKGRLPNATERNDFHDLAGLLISAQSFAIPDVNTLSFPEMGDHLVFRLRRRLSRIRNLFNLRWRVIGRMERNPDSPELLWNRPRSDAETQKHKLGVVEWLGRGLTAKDEQPEDDLYQRLRLSLADASTWQGVKSLLEPARKEDAEIARRAELAQRTATWQWRTLARQIQRELRQLLQGEPGIQNTGELLERVAAYCQPLRDKLWCWQSGRLTREEPERGGLALNPIRGMRGLSMPRIEQLQELRRCCQSLARQENRFAQGCRRAHPGIEPVPIRREEVVQDSCPDLLDRINELRDQRVYQTAHLILTEALGFQLKNPDDVNINGATKRQLHNERDLHGQYEPLRLKDGCEAPRCAVIIVEDLTRYRTSQDRSRFENRRLMEWSHRQIIHKLQDLAKPFGITVVTVEASYSSRFDSRTGVPGIRVKEVGRNFELEQPWKKWAEETSKARKTKGKPTERALLIREVINLFSQNEEYPGTLVLPVDGGPMFLPVGAPKPDQEGLLNADINASANLALRALAHPDRFDIFPLLKTEAAGGLQLKVRNRRGAFALLDSNDATRVLGIAAVKAESASPSTLAADEEPDEELESTAKPNLFVDAAGVLGLTEDRIYRVRLPGTSNVFQAARTPDFWGSVKRRAIQRIRELNDKRIALWRDKTDTMPD